MSIIITRNGRDARRLEQMPIAQEEYVQRYIHDNPESLPLEELEEGLRLLILAREYPTLSGPIDALGVDGSGNLYVIETKLYRNQDKRKVVAQALDYGAALWGAAANGSALLDWLEIAAERAAGMPVRERMAGFYGLQPEGVTELLERMQQNAADGRFRFVILMDKLDDRLKELITFVNRNSQFDIYGVELEFYKFDEHEIVIPKLYGAGTGPKQISTRTPIIWNEESFFKEIASRLSDDEAKAIRSFYDSCRQHATISWGTGKTGSFNPKFPAYHPTVAPFTIDGDGAFYVKVSWPKEPPELTARGLRFAEALRALFGDVIPADPLNNDCFLPKPEWMDRRLEIERAIADCFT